MPSLLSLNSYHYVRGGADRVYFENAEIFRQRGWSTSFFSMRHDGNLPCEDERYFVDCIDFDKRRGRSLSGALKIIYSLEAQRKIGRLLDAKHIDVAHAHCIYHHLSPSVFVELKRRGVPVVMTAHDLKIACPNYRMFNSEGVCERCKGGRVWNVVRHRCIKNSLPASALIGVESAVHKLFGLYYNTLDRIIAPSRFYRDKLIEWGAPADKVVFIPNAVDAPDGPMPPVGRGVLYFGRLAAEKGLSTLVRAAALSGAPVRIAGSGDQEPELRRLAEQLDAPVEFLGFRSGAELWSIVDQARAVVLPSEWYENGPMSVIEAFAKGKPLIGADIGGIPELIDEGRTGWKFVSGDAEDLARALTAAESASEAQLREMAQAARDLYERQFSSEIYYERMRGLYAEVTR